MGRWRSEGYKNRQNSGESASDTFAGGICGIRKDDFLEKSRGKSPEQSEDGESAGQTDQTEEAQQEQMEDIGDTAGSQTEDTTEDGQKEEGREDPPQPTSR